jgi:serine/threonine-protein kinase
MMQAQPDRVFGRYALFDEIAAGGMATVHLGRLIGPVGFSKTVAIKRLHPHLARDPEFVSMFLDEARLAARIQHPNVVGTLDVVAIDGEVFLVLDYVQGESLSRLLKASRAEGRISDVRVVSSILVNVLHGLHAAHEATDEHAQALGIVHRDVSPQNILVGVDGVARVLDFGVAKASGRLQSTRDGQLKGKLAYMAPEQVRGGAVDRRTDIYSASVVLWEGLTGRRLVQTSNEAQVLADVLAGGFPPPSTIAPHLPPHIDAIVMKGLSQNPNDRFNTARQMGIELERALGVASPLVVGEWVQAIAQHALEMRAARVREMESTSAVHMVPASGVAPGTPRMPPARDPREQTGSGISFITSSSLITSPSQVSQPSHVSSASGASVPSGVSSPSGISGYGAAPPPLHQVAWAPPVYATQFMGAPARQTSPAKLVVVVVAITALLTLVGLAALLSLRDRAGEPPPVAAGVTQQAAEQQPVAGAGGPVTTATPLEPQPPAEGSAPKLADEPAKESADPVVGSPEPAAKSSAKPTVAKNAPAQGEKTKPGPTATNKPADKEEKPPAGACDSPFFVDKNGIKHVRPECM